MTIEPIVLQFYIHTYYIHNLICMYSFICNTYSNNDIYTDINRIRNSCINSRHIRMRVYPQYRAFRDIRAVRAGFSGDAITMFTYWVIQLGLVQDISVPSLVILLTVDLSQMKVNVMCKASISILYKKNCIDTDHKRSWPVSMSSEKIFV